MLKQCEGMRMLTQCESAVRVCECRECARMRERLAIVVWVHLLNEKCWVRVQQQQMPTLAAYPASLSVAGYNYEVSAEAERHTTRESKRYSTPSHTVCGRTSE